MSNRKKLVKGPGPWAIGSTTAHRAFFTKKGPNALKNCARCGKPGPHPIHWDRFRYQRNWQGWMKYVSDLPQKVSG